MGALLSELLAAKPSHIILWVLAVSASISVTTALLCDNLDPDTDLVIQMETCTEDTFYYQKSPATVFNLSGLTQSQADALLFSKGPSGPDFDKPKKFKGHVKISGSQLKSLKLGIQNMGTPQTVEIIGNLELNRLEFHLSGGSLADVILTLRGNKQLSMSSIKRLGGVLQINTATSKIQEYEECFFGTNAIKDLSVLVGCSAIDGDLIIDGGTVIPATLPVLRIKNIRNGCVKIENSRLQSLDFLEGLLKKGVTCPSGKHLLKKNNQLCLTSEQQKGWTDANFDVDYTGKCSDKCTVEFAKNNPMSVNPQAKCDVVIGDVKITGSVDPATLAHWDRVKRLEGTLEVDGTSLTGIVIFKNLEEIINHSPEKIALSVLKNAQMTAFDLPTLANITMPPGTWSEPMFVAQNNKKFEFTLTEGERWYRITGRDNLLIPVEAPTTTAVPTTAGPTTTTLSADQLRTLNQKNQAENEEKQKTTNFILYIGCPVTSLLAILATSSFIWCLFRKTCKKGKRRDDHDLVTIATQWEMAKNIVTQQAGKNEESDDKTMALQILSTQYQLNANERVFFNWHQASIEARQTAQRCQMALEAEEIPFTATDMIMDVNAEQLDIDRAAKNRKLAKMKHRGKPFHHMVDYKIAYFNPSYLNYEPVPYMATYDRQAVFKCLLTHCSDFFVINAHLFPKIIEDCSGPHYSKTGTLLTEINGPVRVVGDIHEALHVLQFLLNLDWTGEARSQNIHPALCYKYLFLGDIFDRGAHGLECYFLLCLAVRLFPDRFIFLRGNHDLRKVGFGEKDASINKYGPRLAESRPDIKNPYHFAESMFSRIFEKVSAYLPVAALINGHTLAAHGGFSMALLNVKKSVKELLYQVPLPYYDESQYNHESVERYWGELEENYKTVRDQLDKVKEKDEYTAEHDRRKGDLDRWKENKKQYEKERTDDPNTPPDYTFDPKYPWINELMWSDPYPAIASAGNVRGAGCSFTQEHVNKMTNKTEVENLIRAHQVVGYTITPDGKTTTIFTNCDHMQSLWQIKPGDISTFTDYQKCASILCLNEDGSRTVVFLSISSEKKPDQPLMNLNRRIKRIVGKDQERDYLKKFNEWADKNADGSDSSSFKKKGGGKKSQQEKTKSSTQRKSQQKKSGKNKEKKKNKDKKKKSNKR